MASLLVDIPGLYGNTHIISTYYSIQALVFSFLYTFKLEDVLALTSQS